MLPVRARSLHLDLAPLPIDPLLAAADPIVFLFGTNTVEQVTLDPMRTPTPQASDSTTR